MTFALSKLTVFATAPPHPASNDFAMTRAFVPGGPEPSRKGFGNLMPLTVIESSISFNLRSGCGLVTLRGHKICHQHQDESSEQTREDIEKKRRTHMPLGFKD